MIKMRKLKVLFFVIASALLFSLGFKSIKAALPNKVDIEVSYILLDETPDSGGKITLDDQDFGALVDLEAPDIAGYNFAFWIVNGTLRKDLPANTRIIAQTNTVVIGVYKPDDKHAVIYVDSNGAKIDYEAVDNNEEANVPEVGSLPDKFSKPKATILGFERLDGVIGDVITEDTIYVLKYETNEAGGSLTVDGDVIKETSTLNEEVNLAGLAPAGFKYWEDEKGQVLSKDPNYAFTMLGFDRVIKSVTSGGEVVDPIVNITDDLDLRENYRSFVGQFDGVPSEFEFLISKEAILINDYDQVDVIVARSSSFNEKTNEFMMSFPLDVLSIRAYAIYDGELVLSELYSVYPNKEIGVDEINAYVDGEFVVVNGIVLQEGYSETITATSKIDSIFVQDKLSGNLVVIKGLEGLYGNQLKKGYEIKFEAKVVESEEINNKYLEYWKNVEVIDEEAGVLDYKVNAIVISSHEDGLVEFAANFHYGQVFNFEGPMYFNSTTTDDKDLTNLRFHLNENASGLSDIQYGGKSLVFNVNSNKPVIGENFVEDLFGFAANPGTGRPGTLKYVNLYFVVKSDSDSYYYCVLLDETDVVVMDTDFIVEDQITRSLPKEMVAGDMVLPTTHELLDGNIIWVSDKPEVIANDGSVTYPNDEVTVTLTASFVVEAIEYEFSVEILVKPKVPLSVSEVLSDAGEDDTVLVEGIIVGFHWNGSKDCSSDTNGIIIKDETGNEILYVIGLYSNYDSIRAEYDVDGHILAKGDKIRFVATFNTAVSEGHIGRKTLIIQSAEIANLQVLESDVDYEFDLESAVIVSEQDDLAEIAENLPYGTLFKLTGDFGFRGSASTYGDGVNLQTSYVRGVATDYNMSPSWADRGQRFSFKFDGNAPNLGANWWTTLLGIDSTTYTGTTASGMTFEEGAYIYFYIGHSLPKAASSNGYIQLVILDPSWVNATLKQ